jgi:hypothetical protein
MLPSRAGCCGGLLAFSRQGSGPGRAVQQRQVWLEGACLVLL